jgi:hypothetical protein
MCQFYSDSFRFFLQPNVVVFLTSSYVNWDFSGMSGPRRPRVHTGENFQILTVEKNCYLNLRAPKKFFLQPSKKRDFYASLSSRKVCHF